MLLQKKVITRFAIYAFLFIGLFSSYACQESSWTEDIEISTQTDEKPGDQTVLKRPTPPENPSEVLERRMQWASYIAAKVLCQDAEARTEVMELLMIQESEYLDLDQLLLQGPQALAGHLVAVDAAALEVAQAVLDHPRVPLRFSLARVDEVL